MKIGVVGGGSIGLLIGAYLSENHDVTIFTRSSEQASIINDDGVILAKDNGRIRANCSAKPIGQLDFHPQDLLIITVKQYHLQDVIPNLPIVHTNLLFLQNGMGHLSFCRQLSDNHDVFVGIVEHGALRTDLNQVVHTGKGAIKIAPFTHGKKEISGLTGTVNFPIRYEEEYESMLLKKLCVNAMINPLTAVLRVKNGELLANSHYHQVFMQQFQELAAILELTDVNGMRKHIEEVCQRTKNNISSMRKDVEEGKPTEVDAILGYILGIANERHTPAPLIASMYSMIKGKEYERKEH